MAHGVYPILCGPPSHCLHLSHWMGSQLPVPHTLAPQDLCHPMQTAHGLTQPANTHFLTLARALVMEVWVIPNRHPIPQQPSAGKMAPWVLF